ncbi:hypothetical protein EUX98_g3242 [Antrodiella citrinella]|uniref:Pali-domain-containing protein n=1 Tax=Antrodiella citrinella TaxID=2447956 RepID=A0A4S4MX15_9APHY|nr:hypothetical protein EUX98_g3242 [Antrodiella citrinella]
MSCVIRDGLRTWSDCDFSINASSGSALLLTPSFTLLPSSLNPTSQLTMAAGAAGPGLFFTFTAMLLLIFASVSAPTWNPVSFLNTNVGGQQLHFGVFGFTGSQVHVGWRFPPNISDSRLGGDLYHGLTFALILIPIGAGLSGLAFLFGLCGFAYHRAGTVFMTLVSGVALLVTLVAWVIEMVLFGVARDHIRNRGDAASFGNANWLVLGAFIALLLAFFASACGICGSYRAKRSAY